MLRASANIGHSGKSALPAPVCVSRADVWGRVVVCWTKRCSVLFQARWGRWRPYIVLPVVPRQRWSPRKVLAKLLRWMMGSSLGKIMGDFTIENSDLSQGKWGFDGIFMIFMDIHMVINRDQRIWLGFRLLYLDWLRYPWDFHSVVGLPGGSNWSLFWWYGSCRN